MRINESTIRKIIAEETALALHEARKKGKLAAKKGGKKVPVDSDEEPKKEQKRKLKKESAIDRLNSELNALIEGYYGRRRGYGGGYGGGGYGGGYGGGDDDRSMIRHIMDTRGVDRDEAEEILTDIMDDIGHDPDLVHDAVYGRD